MEDLRIASTFAGHRIDAIAGRGGMVVAVTTPVYNTAVVAVSQGAFPTTWTVRRRTGSGRYRADVLFPSWGRRAQVLAVRADGSHVVVGRRPLPLDGVAYFSVRSERSGYVVAPRRLPSGATARLLRVRPQPSAPHPGPTLALRVGSGGRATLTARLTPVRQGQEAAVVATRLRDDR